MHSIGRHGAPWTVETARAKALELLATLATGTDPFAKPPTDATFGSEVERYLVRKQASLAARTYVEVRRHLSDYAAPLHKLPIGEIDDAPLLCCWAKLRQALAQALVIGCVHRSRPFGGGPSLKGLPKLIRSKEH